MDKNCYSRKKNYNTIAILSGSIYNAKEKEKRQGSRICVKNLR